MPQKLRAHAGQQVLQPGIDRIFHRDRVARPKQHAADQVERLLAAVGDHEVVARAGEVLCLRLVQQMAAQRLDSRSGEPNCRMSARSSPRQHGCAARAKFVQRKKVARRPRHHEADHFPCRNRRPPRRRSERSSSDVQSTPAGAARVPPVTKLPRPTCPAIRPCCFQHLVGGGNGGAIQSKQASQFASGW